MIHMQEKHKKMVMDILQKYPYTFYAFGSRVTGKNRPLSDLDICFIEDIPLSIQSNIKEDFELSNIPFLVDLVDFNTCDSDFQKRIMKDLELLQGEDLIEMQ